MSENILQPFTCIQIIKHFEHELKQQSFKLLRSTAKMLDGYKVESVSVVGDPRLRLIQLIKNIDPSVVVVGSKGAVCRYLLNHAQVPVMVMP